MKILRFIAPALMAASSGFAQNPSPAAAPAPTAPPPAATPAANSKPPAPTPTPASRTPREIIDKLSDAQLSDAIKNLRANFLDPSQTDERQMQRATLEGLITRLAPGLVVTTEAAVKQAATGSPAFLAEILDNRIGYVRLGTLSREALSQMDAALANFQEKKLHAIILDLRGAPASADYEVAAEFARRFCPKGKVLFSVQKPSAKQERILTSNQDPSFTGVLVVLTDKSTSGSSEVLAAVLRQEANAMIVGATTRGEAVEFSDATLGDGKILRIAVAQVVVPGAGAIFPNGVKPDIAAALSTATQTRIFALSKEKGVSQFVFETERPHFNEAALVANTNPEIDPSAMREDDHSASWDTVLQRAVDLVTAISFYHKAGPR